MDETMVLTQSDKWFTENPNFEIYEDWYPKEWIVFSQMINWDDAGHIRLKSNWKYWMRQNFHLGWNQILEVISFLEKSVKKMKEYKKEKEDSTSNIIA